MISNVVSQLVRVATSNSQSQENFDLQDSMDLEKIKKASVTDLIIGVVTFIIILIILAFVGMVLWNYVVAGADKGSGILTFAKPANSVWQILGLYILISLLFGK